MFETFEALRQIEYLPDQERWDQTLDIVNDSEYSFYDLDMAVDSYEAGWVLRDFRNNSGKLAEVWD
jgi:hypothetical protein